jgi:Leucine-rich repeat (LRR) protein
VQRVLAQVWRYFDPADYAQTVLQDAPLDHGKISVTLVDHIPHLRTLQNLRDVSLNLFGSGTVDDLAFLRDAPPATTSLHVQVSGPVDLSPLANCPALEIVRVNGGSVSAGLETLSTIPKLRFLNIHLPGGGLDLSFLADCPALVDVIMEGCTRLSDLSALASASRLRFVYLFNAKRLRDLGALTELPDLRRFLIADAPLTGGLAAVTPILSQLENLSVWSVPTVTSLDALAGSTLTILNLADCPITDLEPLGTLRSLTEVWLQQLPGLSLAPLASLPRLRELTLGSMKEPVDLSPLAQTDHRLRVELRDTLAVGDPGPLVKIRRR